MIIIIVPSIHVFKTPGTSPGTFTVLPLPSRLFLVRTGKPNALEISVVCEIIKAPAAKPLTSSFVQRCSPGCQDGFTEVRQLSVSAGFSELQFYCGLSPVGARMMDVKARSAVRG